MYFIKNKASNLIITSLILLLVNSCNFSNKKKSDDFLFDRIEYASFKINKSEKLSNDSLFVKLYSIIDNNGFVKVVNYDDYHDSLKFYAYQLNKMQLSTVAQVFNPSKKLNDYFVRKELSKDEFYEGEYHFFWVSYKNGKSDSLTFISPFMTDSFNLMYNMLNNEVYYGNKTNPYQSFLIPEKFKDLVFKCFQESNYLPRAKGLPFK